MEQPQIVNGTASENMPVRKPIRRGMLRASVLFALTLCILLSALSYFVFSRGLHSQYNQRLSEVVTYIEHHIDADDLRKCMETGEHSEKYDLLQDFLNGMIDDLGLAYIYIVVPEEKVMVNVISATSAAEFAAGDDNMPLGETTDFYDEASLARYRSFWNNQETGYFEESSEWGAYYTAVKPIRSSDGETFAILCVDEDISEVQWSIWKMVLFSVLLVVVAFAVFLLLMNVWMRRRVIEPLTLLERSTEEFSVKSRDARDLSEMQYELPEIHSENELQSLAKSFGRMAEAMRARAEEIAGARDRAKRAEEENRRLSEEADAARKIAELTESLHQLFNNIPGMAYSKDAETGRYTACNQSFAAYTHKTSPREVVGLTDAEIFDAETAAHFAETDKAAVNAEEPIVYYEDVPDAAGNPLRLQTTKLKFTDSKGRLSVLGMSVDVTELTQMRQKTQEATLAYEAARSSSVTYANLAQALATDYEHLYYIDIETDDYVEYRSDAHSNKLVIDVEGTDFFNRSREMALDLIYPDDQVMFLESFKKDNILNAIAARGAFTVTYRQCYEGEPVYMNMKITRMSGDDRHITIGISNVDAQMRYQELMERTQEELTTYSRITALAGDIIAIYSVDPETDQYSQYSAMQRFQEMGFTANGEDFFNHVRSESVAAVHPDDALRFLTMFKKSIILEEIRNNGVFVLTYRYMINGAPLYISAKAAMVKEKDGQQLIVGFINIDAQVRQEQEYERKLTVARNKANVDALTGVRNKHAYGDAEAELNRRISEGEAPEFAVLSLDVNNLKEVNDTKGHAAGDLYLKQACGIICRVFAHSPVYRVGGDEFIVISQGEDYQNADALLRELRRTNKENEGTDLPQVAAGIARYNGESSVAELFDRADKAMYVEKQSLKGS